MTRPDDLSKLPPAEKQRRELVRLELSQGKPTLIETDLSHATPQDLAIADHVFKAATIVERLYAKQKGSDVQAAKVPADDLASQSLFFRNQGAACVAPKTEKNPECSAIPEKPSRVVGLYRPSCRRSRTSARCWRMPDLPIPTLGPGGVLRPRWG